jgi:hypothetical protein
MGSEDVWWKGVGWFHLLRTGTNTEFYENMPFNLKNVIREHHFPIYSVKVGRGGINATFR